MKKSTLDALKKNLEKEIFWEVNQITPCIDEAFESAYEKFKFSHKEQKELDSIRKLCIELLSDLAVNVGDATTEFYSKIFSSIIANPPTPTEATPLKNENTVTIHVY